MFTIALHKSAKEKVNFMAMKIFNKCLTTISIPDVKAQLDLRWMDGI